MTANREEVIEEILSLIRQPKVIKTNYTDFTEFSDEFLVEWRDRLKEEREEKLAKIRKRIRIMGEEKNRGGREHERA